MDTAQKQMLLLSSIPLRKLDGNLRPVAFASGALINYAGKRVLLTVRHALNSPGNWAAEMKYVHGKGTQLHQLGAANFVSVVDIASGTISDVDFAFVQVDGQFVPCLQSVRCDGAIEFECPRILSSVDFEREPTPEEEYGFSGQVTMKEEGGILNGVMSVYDGLRFRRTEGDYHVFSIPKYDSHDAFKGCSGAPIIDSQGNTVALVCRGNTVTKEIRGVSLRKYHVTLQGTFGVTPNS